MTDHAEALKRAATRYKRAQERAKQIMVEPRQELADAIRAAYADKMKKADIIRATDHVWSRQWVDQTVKKDGEPPDE
jgi:hypothetical protein